MEKGYEAYQHLGNNNLENDINPGPYLIVQDGTFMSNNKPIENIQYITHIQNDKDIENVTCPMYDVNSQPYYIDLNVSPELMTPITVNSIESVTPSAVYSNNYVSSNSSGQLVQNDNVDLKQSIEDLDANKQIAGYAEVTLTDGQYELLKEKGWILLQIKEKIFLLDTSGLHEITNNQKLVNKLKLAMVSKNNQDIGSSMDMACNDSESMAFEDANVIVQQDISVPQNFLVHSEPVKPIAPSTEDQTSKKEKSSMQQINGANTNNNMKGKKKPTKVVLKSQFHVKDIPNKIILGKTAKGKNLVARVLKGKGITKNERRPDETVKSDTTTYCRMEDVTLAKAVVAQLLHVPEFKIALHKHKLIITKTLAEENNKESIKKEKKETLITGQMIMDGPKAEFVYVPDMITEHVKNCELNNKGDGNVKRTESETPNENMFLHINITETKGVDVSKILVTVKEKYLSLSQMYNMKSEHLTSTYTCPDCATIFKTQEELDDHQNEKSLNKGCQMQNHLQLYKKENVQEATDVTKYLTVSVDKTHKEVVYKCKMCPNTYFQTSSLTKHILAKHVKTVKQVFT